MRPAPGPKTIRTPRTRALEIGTDPGGFPDNADGDFNSQAGVPEDVAGGTYQNTVPNGGATPSSTKIPDPSPFKIGPA